MGLGKWVVSEESIKTPRRKNVSLKYLPGPETIKLCDSNDVKSKLSGSPYLSIRTRRIRAAAGMGGKGNTHDGTKHTPSLCVPGEDPPQQSALPTKRSPETYLRFTVIKVLKAK